MTLICMQRKQRTEASRQSKRAKAGKGGVRGGKHGVMHLAYLPLICILSSYPCCFLYPSARAGATDCVTKGTHEPRLGLDFSFGASSEVAYANRRGRRLR